MTLKQIIARVMRALPNLPPGSIGEQDIIDMLNEAQRSLAVLSNRFVVEEYELDADYDTVAFPDDLLKLVAVYWGDDETKRELYPDLDMLPKSNYIEDDDSDDTTGGWPTKYHTKDNRVILRPIPTEDNTVTIAYINKPTEMVDDTDLPELEGSAEYLIAHALQRLHLEAGSRAAQTWEYELMKAEKRWRESSDQNYEAPFKVTGFW